VIRIFERTVIQEFTLNSIAASSTGGGPLDFLVNTGQNIFNGILRGVSVACGSTNFDISLRTNSAALANTVDEIYRVTGINKFRSDDNLYQGWINNDVPVSSNIYTIITNNDAGNATGPIVIKIVSDINRKFTR